MVTMVMNKTNQTGLQLSTTKDVYKQGGGIVARVKEGGCKERIAAKLRRRRECMESSKRCKTNTVEIHDTRHTNNKQYYQLSTDSDYVLTGSAYVLTGMAYVLTDSAYVLMDSAYVITDSTYRQCLHAYVLTDSAYVLRCLTYSAYMQYLIYF